MRKKSGESIDVVNEFIQKIMAFDGNLAKLLPNKKYSAAPQGDSLNFGKIAGVMDGLFAHIRIHLK